MTDNCRIAEIISAQSGLKYEYVLNTVNLFKDGCTVPFVARYRKERTGNMDENQVRMISGRIPEVEAFEARKKYILKTVRGLVSPDDDVLIRMDGCEDPDYLEDLFLPFKPKKTTRASAAREKGLEALAVAMLSGKTGLRESILSAFVDPVKNVSSTEEALNGAMDIIAEIISESPEVRLTVRHDLCERGIIHSSVKKDKKDEASKFSNYYSYSGLLKNQPHHRLLAIIRGQTCGFLSVKLSPADNDVMMNCIKRKFITAGNPFSGEIIEAAEDSIKRLVLPSVSSEVLKKRIMECGKKSIELFSQNLKNLLLAPYAGEVNVLGVDPGFRSGCKIAAVGKTGELLGCAVIYPNEPQNRKADAAALIGEFVEKYSIDYIAIGNGSAGRETHEFLCSTAGDIPSVMVSESGASVYSASKEAAEEFPDLDLTLRGAVNIARRFKDPLSELVKIDPKSIGVGQYQHDVDQNALDLSLRETAVQCVSSVGVDLNTASKELLSFVSGINPAAAAQIVLKRSELGGFRSRAELMSVQGIGEKVFEQCAAFLRIRNSVNPLDNTAVHPENYAIAEKIALQCGCSVSLLAENPGLLDDVDAGLYGDSAGEYTVSDIIHELKSPGRDPRKKFSYAEFNSVVRTIDDLREGMILNAVVTNVTAFGAFADIGVHMDGLIHVSNLSDSFIGDPFTVVSAGDCLMVKVISVDKQLRRISLKRMTDGQFGKSSAD